MVGVPCWCACLRRERRERGASRAAREKFTATIARDSIFAELVIIAIHAAYLLFLLLYFGKLMRDWKLPAFVSSTCLFLRLMLLLSRLYFPPHRWHVRLQGALAAYELVGGLVASQWGQAALHDFLPANFGIQVIPSPTLSETSLVIMIAHIYFLVVFLVDPFDSFLVWLVFVACAAGLFVALWHGIHDGSISAKLADHHLDGLTHCGENHIFSEKKLERQLIKQTRLFALTCACFALAVVSKTLLNRKSWAVFILLEEKINDVVEQKVLRRHAELQCEEKSKDVVEQKVLRCHAEFQCEQLMAGKGQRQTTGPNKCLQPVFEDQVQGLHVSDANRAVPSDCEISLLSCQSAPTVINLNVCTAGCSEDYAGNCLPADAVVWVQDKPLPIPLHSVTTDHQVLCYDHVTHGMKHARIAEIGQQSHSTDWVTISLEDGTSLSMTADHPVQQIPLGSHDLYAAARTVNAADLLPDAHAVMVLKMVRVPVKKVERYVPPGQIQIDCDGKDVAAQPRVALRLQQPERFSIFVAPSAGCPTLAVGSVGLQSNAAAPYWRNRRTFLDIGSSEPTSSQGRANSAPPAFGEAAPSIGRGKSESGNSGNQSSDFEDQDFLGEVSIEVGSTGHADVNMSGEARISDILSMKAAGLKSSGSAGHHEQTCKVCHFEFTNRRTRQAGCRLGAFCRFCHDPSHRPV